MKNKILILLVVFFASFSAASANEHHSSSPTQPANAQTSDATSDDAITQADSDYNYENSDPAEPVNRAIFKFNNVIDGVLLKPVARGYKYVVPQWGRARVSNALYNLTEPVTVLNSVLQADPQNAFTSLWRFILNSTFGLLGTFDVASDFGLKPRQEDFGQTLGVWGWKDSDYVELPIIGPSTLRDTLGLGVDYVSNPFYNGMVTDNDYVVYGLLGIRLVDTRANYLEVTDQIDRTSLDTYATYRSAYLQKRANDIKNGQSRAVANNFTNSSPQTSDYPHSNNRP